MYQKSVVLVLTVVCGLVINECECANAPSPSFSFFKDAYHGRLANVNAILEQHPYRAYETNELDEPVIAVALRNKQSEVSLRLIDEYERDLAVVERFFAKQEVPVEKSKWIGQPILIAAGDDKIELLNSLITREILMMSHIYGDRKGLVVLTKPSSSAVAQEVFWLSAPGSSHDHKIAKIIHALYGSGTIDVLRKAAGASLLQIAAENQMEVAFQRLERLFGDGIQWTGSDYYPLLCHLAKAYNSDEQQLEVFEKQIKSINRFEIGEVIQSDTAVRLLEIPFQLNQSMIFAYMLDKIASQTNDEKNQILTKFVNLSNQFSWSSEVDRTFLAQLCIQHSVNLIENESDTNNALEIFNRNSRVIPAIDAYIVEHMAAILNRQGAVEELLNTFIVNNRTGFISDLYRSHPELVNHLKNATQPIQFAYRGGFVDVASLLIDLHSEQLTAEGIFQYVLEFSSTERYVPILQQLLRLPQAENLIIKTQSSEPLANALFGRKLKNYLVLLDSIRTKPDVTTLTHGPNLLALAIWTKKDVLVENFRADGDGSAVQRLYKSEYDDDDTNEKSTPSACTVPSVWSPNYEKHSSEYYIKEKEHYDTIFQELIDLGYDYHSLVDGKSLIHVAVQNDNIFVLKKLIELGVNAMTLDSDGNLPVHHVKSVDAFELLIQTMPENAMSTKNSHGQTPVDVVQASTMGCTYPALVDAMVAVDRCKLAEQMSAQVDDQPESLFGRPLPFMSKFDSAIYQQNGIKSKVLKAAQLIALTEDPTFERLGYCETTDSRVVNPPNFVRDSILGCLCEAKNSKSL